MQTVTREAVIPQPHDRALRFATAMQSALSVAEVEQAFLEHAPMLVHAAGFAFYRLDPQTGRAMSVAADVCGELLDEYESYGRADDPVLEMSLAHGQPVDSSQAVTDEQWQECGARNALGTAGFAHSMEAPVLVAGAVYGTVNFARTAEQGRFVTADLMAARAANEQLQLAVERALRFETTGHRAGVLELALDRVPQPLLITDLDAVTIFRNRAAIRAEAQPGRAGRSAQAAIDNGVREAMVEFRRDGKRVSTRSVRDGEQHLIIRSYRLPERADAAVTLVYDCQDRAADTLPVWDVLTRREQEIASLVSQGLTTKEIAQRAFVSENTVKQHLKRVFAKTDVHNRAELMARIWSSGRETPPTGGARPGPDRDRSSLTYRHRC